MTNSVTAFFLNEILLYDILKTYREMFVEIFFLDINGDCKICEHKTLTYDIHRNVEFYINGP